MFNVLREIKDIPTLPQVTVELIRHAFLDEPDIQRVASIIEKDPTLTAKLFKTVNSAYFGLRVEVKNVSQAVSILGLETLRATIISIALGEYFINKSFGNALEAKDFCIHSLATAVVMRELALVLGIREAEQLYLLGLLHDLGKFVLDALPNSNYDEVLRRVNQGTPVEQAEREVFGWDNKQVWLLLARTWGFPYEIVSLSRGTVRGSIEISTEKFIEEASQMAETLGYTFIAPYPRVSSMQFKILSDVTEEKLKRVGQIVQSQVEMISEILNLPVPDKTQIFRVLYRISRQLSAANSKFKKIQGELEFRVEVLEELTRVFTGIIKSLHSESLAISVVEALIEGFRVDSAFLLTHDNKGGLQGYAAWIANEDPGFHQIQLERDEITPLLKKCGNGNLPLKVNLLSELDELEPLLGDVSLAWLAPIDVRGRCTSVIGLGIKDKGNRKFNNDDFGKILNIVSGEIGLSMENSRLYNRVKKEARTDPLTCINNRRTIMKVLNSEFARFKRHGIPLSVAIFDLDHFKVINDTRGHLAGDEFLVRTAKILKGGIRECDYIGRFGGDEFFAVFPGATAHETKTIVERIRDVLLEYCAAFDGPDIGKKLSVSVGVAAAEESMTQPDQLILLADSALYKAKEMGRNHSVVAESKDTSPV